MQSSTPILAQLLGVALRHHVRGSSWATRTLANRLKSLQSVPLRVGEGRVFVDLRHGASHTFLAAAPCPVTVFEPEVQTFFGRLLRRGDIVFDIGANLGWYSVLAAEGGALVHAFEPQPALCRLLGQTVAALPGASLYPVALSNEAGTVEFFVPADHTMGGLRNWVAPHLPEMPVETVRVQARRLDDLVRDGLPLPDVIKIDVEGAERLVFEGATETLDRSDAPIILMEAGARSAEAFHLEQYAALDFLLSLTRPNWSVFHVHDGKLQIGRGDADFVTVVAVPALKADRIAST